MNLTQHNVDEDNIILLTDSYKPTHWKALLPNTQHILSYFESRRGAQYPETVFFGLQYLIKRYLVGVQVTTEKIDEAEDIFKAHFGHSKYFNRAGWEHIRDVWGGMLPITIKAVPEGTAVPTGNVLMTVINMGGKETAFLTNYLETLLTHVWAPSTVATLSREVKKVYKQALENTADSDAGIDFMLHDFGFRGVSSRESAGIESLGHLINFKGTDTLAAIQFGRKYYNADLTSLAFSVAATEHMVMTQSGREGEFDVVKHVLDVLPDGVVSVVADSYHIFDHAKQLGTTFKDIILNRDGVYVVRPDSGDPEETTLKLITILGTHFGYTVNGKGFKVLNPKIRVIWGDGIEKRGIENVLGLLMVNGWSAENMVFGMGGGLLQKINRDTQRFAFKCCGQMRDDVWYEIYKDPLDGTKASKRGFLKLIKDQDGVFQTVKADTAISDHDDIMETVFMAGMLMKEYTFDQVRDNAKL